MTIGSFFEEWYTVIPVWPLVCTNKETCLWHAFHSDELQTFLLQHWRQWNRSTINRAINSPRLCAVSDQFCCEILHSEFQRCFVCDNVGGVGFAKKDLTSFGRDFWNRPPERDGNTKRAKWVSLSSPIRSRLILHAWCEWRESKIWAKLRGGWPHKWQSRFRIWPRDCFTPRFNRGR